MTYEYIQVTYGWYTSTYEWHTKGIWVHIDKTQVHIQMACKWHASDIKNIKPYKGFGAFRL